MLGSPGAQDVRREENENYLVPGSQSLRVPEMLDVLLSNCCEIAAGLWSLTAGSLQVPAQVAVVTEIQIIVLFMILGTCHCVQYYKFFTKNSATI